MTNFQQLEANNLLRILSNFLSGVPFVKILLPFLAIALIFCLLAYILRALFALRLFLMEKQTILEITPPLLTEKEPYEQLFSLIHALGRQKTLKEKLLGRRIQLSLEIV